MSESNYTEVNPLFFQVANEIPESAAFEIVPGMTGEEMKAMFFNAALIEPPYKVFQLNSSGHRYYYKFDDDGNPEFYPSVTTILGQTIPKGKHLFNWIIEHGVEESERIRDDRAAYGTFMHGEFAKLIINRSYDLDNLKNELKFYIQTNNLPDDFIHNADALKKDVLAFAQLIIDYDIKPMAVEIALVHPTLKYAGMMDLPCDMLDRKNGTNRIKAGIDFKSGRKGFFEEHEIQLHLYKNLWNVNFPENTISHVFNFSPKDWRKKPSYNFVDQTNSVNAQKIPAILALASIEDGKKSNIFTAISGQIDLDKKDDFTENIVSFTLAEIIKKKQPKEKTPDENVKIKSDDLNPDIDLIENKPLKGFEKIKKRTSHGKQTIASIEKESPGKELKNDLLNSKIDI